jgi:hypothetical protein
MHVTFKFGYTQAESGGIRTNKGGISHSHRHNFPPKVTSRQHKVKLTR